MTEPYDVGDIATLRIAVGNADATTAVSFTVTHPDQTTSVHPATAGDPFVRPVRQPDGTYVDTTFTPYDALCPLDTPGTWVAVGTVTGTGAGVQETTLTVAPAVPAGPPPNTDPTTDVGRMRLYIPDLDPALLLFTDAQLQAFLNAERLFKRAVAAALDTIASSEAMVGKVIRTQDLATDGTKVAAELRARAAGLRDQADDDAEAGNGGLTIVDFDPWPCAPELAERPWF